MRHLQGMPVLCEQVQALLPLDPSAATHAPLARSTWSDALAAPTRWVVLTAAIPGLVSHARAVLPDRLSGIPGLGQRPVRAIDGTDQKESAHFRRRTPKEGGKDNPKGHALLSFSNRRLGVAEDVHVETRSRHETLLLRDYDPGALALTRERNTLWRISRAHLNVPTFGNQPLRLAHHRQRGGAPGLRAAPPGGAGDHGLLRGSRVEIRRAQP